MNKKLKKCLAIKIMLLCIAICSTNTVQADSEMIPIPISLSLGFSGGMEKYAQNGKNAAELAVKKIEQNGGILIDGKKYTIKLIETDNRENPSFAVKATLNNIYNEHVIAIVGPYNSDTAMMMSALIEPHKVPMITPWASLSKITLNKKYIFRLSVSSDIQAKAITKFANERWNNAKAAILYDEINEYSKKTAKTFQQIFTKENGSDALVAVETFRSERVDVSKHLQKIAETDASFIFLPVASRQVLSIVEQAKAIGITKPFIGGDWRSRKNIAQKCGTDCNGFKMLATFVPKGASGKAKEFVDEYKNSYGEMPGEGAALTYDSILILAEALSSMPSISGNILEDRKQLRDKIAYLNNIDLVTGKISYNGSGEPKRCALLMTMKNGEVFQEKYICP